MRYYHSIYFYASLSIIILMMPFLTFAQTKDEIPLKAFLFKIEKKYDISIVYKSELVINQYISSSKRIRGGFEKSFRKILSPYHIKVKQIGIGMYTLERDEVSFLISENKKIRGIIKGIIYDETGAPLQGANVYLDKTTIGTSTDADGIYELKNIPVGNYKLEVSYLGYLTPITKVIIRRRNRIKKLNFTLKPDLLSLQTLVISGVNQPIVNLKSGVAVSAIYADDLARISPRSTADAFQNIPGFYLETSSGEVSNNLFSRGMPSENGYQYVAIHEDGLPVYETGNLAWVTADHFVRIDGTTKYIEGMRGGSAGVFASNAPGGIINFVSKTGGSKRSGEVKMQTADFGQLRMDANVGGSIVKALHYHIGGYYRIDNGIRKPGYIANQGGQIKGNITKVFNNGYIRISGKYLNDRNILYGAIPLKNNKETNEIEPLEGFDPNYGTMSSSNIRKVVFPSEGEEKEFDLADGMHTHLGYLGTHIQFDIGEGWSIVNKNRFSKIEKQSNAIIPFFAPMRSDKFIEDNFEWTGINPISMTFVGTGKDFNRFNGNGLVMEAGWWANNNKMDNFINSLEIHKKEEKYQVSSNVYCSYFTNQSTQDWGNMLLEVNSDQPQAIDIKFLKPNGNVAEHGTHNGFTTYETIKTYHNTTGNAWVLANYITGKFYFDKETSIDGGFRFEYLSANGNLQKTKLGNFNQTAEVNNVLSEVPIGDTLFTNYSVKKSDVAWTLGFTHLLTDFASVYVRITDSYRMPDFDNWAIDLENGGVIEGIFQAEMGYKYASEQYAFLFSGFYSYISDQVTTEATIDEDGEAVPARTRDALSYGGEFEAVANIFKGFSINMTSTLQRAVYIVKEEDELEIDGNDVKRIPNIFLALQPTYEFKGVKFFGNTQYVGQRFSDEINSDILPHYISFNAGVSYKYKSCKVLIHAQNLTNTIGLTEGSTHVLADTSDEQYRMGRPILGRSVIAHVAYQF